MFGFQCVTLLQLLLLLWLLFFFRGKSTIDSIKNGFLLFSLSDYKWYLLVYAQFCCLDDISLYTMFVAEKSYMFEAQKQKRQKKIIEKKETIVPIVRRFFTRDNYVINFWLMTNIRVVILGGRTNTTAKQQQQQLRKKLHIICNWYSFPSSWEPKMQTEKKNNL